MQYRLDKFGIKRPGRGKGPSDETPDGDENDAQELDQ
jgi:hypothetical protein